MKPILKKSLTISGVVFLVAISFFAGLYVDAQNKGLYSLSLNTTNNKSAESQNINFDPFWKAWSLINEKFVESTTASSTTNEEKVNGAIKGLVDSLGDPYSQFFDPEESKAFNTELSGSLEGVGMTVGIRNELISVIAPIKGSPAERAGVMAGDVILKIDGKETLSLTVEEAIKLIRGKKGTVVNLTLGREGKSEPIVITVTRDVINVPTLETKKLKNGVFVISLYEFNAQASALFRVAMKNFYSSGSSKLIIDLRGNPGGYLESAVDIGSWFIGSGKTIVTEDYGKKRSPVVHRSKGYNIFSPNMKMVVLIDKGSASASEILAGALSEYGIATLVGEKSYGKGSVQELLNITKETSMKITVAKWLTPKGKSISKEGLIPAFDIKLTPEDVKNGNDPQLDKALEIVNR